METQKLIEKNNILKEYLRKALNILDESIEVFDIEKEDSEDLEDKIKKFKEDIKRKRIL